MSLSVDAATAWSWCGRPGYLAVRRPPPQGKDFRRRDATRAAQSGRSPIPAFRASSCRWERLGVRSAGRGRVENLEPSRRAGRESGSARVRKPLEDSARQQRPRRLLAPHRCEAHLWPGQVPLHQIEIECLPRVGEQPSIDPRRQPQAMPQDRATNATSTRSGRPGERSPGELRRVRRGRAPACRKRTSESQKLSLPSCPEDDVEELESREGALGGRPAKRGAGLGAARSAGQLRLAARTRDRRARGPGDRSPAMSRFRHLAGGAGSPGRSGRRLARHSRASST